MIQKERVFFLLRFMLVLFYKVLSIIPICQWTHPHISLKILAEERHIGKVERVGNFLNGEIGGFQL